jgi:hypothetical protein
MSAVGDNAKIAQNSQYLSEEEWIEGRLLADRRRA